MVDWMQLLVSNWWVLAIIVTTIFVVMRIHHFFRFFTALVTMVALFYVATIIFFPPSDNLPTKEISKVLGVSTSVVDESTSSTDMQEIVNSSICSYKVDSRESFTKCVSEWGQKIQMPDLNEFMGKFAAIKYEESK